MNQNIRNFVIIAHVDHGKSTLADRFLEVTGTVEKRLMRPQYLDQLELERERGITIKMAPVRMLWHPHRGITRTDTLKDAEVENRLIYEDITYKIRGAAFEVRKKLGLGHKEILYQKALAEEFRNLGLSFEQEKIVEVHYDNKKIGTYQPDFVVEQKIIVELKALPSYGRAEEEQVWSYIKGSSYRLALLINFGSRELEIKRIVYDTARIPRDSASSPRESAEIEYILNLIDTPGHSDFSYEVSRALAAVEGAILLVDATQGIQAQTLANYDNAKKAGLTLIGAVNKIDAASHEQIKTVRKDLAELLGAPEEEILLVSGKTGAGVEELLAKIIEKIPPPKFQISNYQLPITNQALIFDSIYDDHKGVIAYVRVFAGIFRNTDYKEIGYFTPQLKPTKELSAGAIGYIATGIKDPGKIKIGGTIGAPPLPGYREPQPVVFVSFYPEDANDYDALRQALGKLRLNDAALHFESDMSEILGRGFKGGFLGRLHFEITAERLARGEFSAKGGSASGGKVKTVHSFPSVAYQVKLKNDGWITITNPKDFPSDYAEVLEPMTKAEILAPPRYLGDILKLKELFRFSDIEVKTTGSKALVAVSLPLADLISDLDDKLKSISEGYASLSYESIGWARGEVVKLEVLVTENVVPGLTRIVPEKYVEQEGRATVIKLKKLLPQEQFTQAIQARAHGRIIARETIPALRKDVTGYLYGGDRTRKMKLWKKQQKGKKKLKELATREPVKIPASIFKELLKK